MTWITRIALKKRWVTILLSALVAGTSVWAMLTLKMELIPDIELPMTTVITFYPDAPPDEIMEKVTIPIEETVKGISGFKHVASTSSEGSSVVFFQFEFGTDMDTVNAAIAANIAQLDLPPEVRNLPELTPELDENPILQPININLIPVVTLSLSGDIPDDELMQTALTEVVPQLAEIDGVINVSIEGGSGDKVLVNPSLDAMIEYNISTAQLAGALMMGSYDSLADVENTIVSQQGILLKQVADVSVGPATGSAISRTNGKPSISISVTKDSTANTVTTANAVLEKVEEIAASLPAGLELTVVMDQSEYIEASVSDLTNNVLLGSGLAVLVVFVFLMAFRASLVTAVSIPLSLLISFLVMRFTGITINILTLSAMIIAVGRVIDNSIVILEVLYRRMQHGERFYDAAVNGVREVVTPITSATIATVVIFIPLTFVGGIVGEVFLPFGLTITYALIGSLLIALTVVPALSGYLVSTKTQEEPRPYWYQRGYTASLRWCLNHRLATISVALVLFLGSFLLVPIIGTTFMPEMNTNMLTVDVEMPKGTTLTTLNEVTVEVENVLGDNPWVMSYNTVAGAATGVSGEINALFGMGGSSNTATIQVITIPDADTNSLVEQLETDLTEITDTGTIRVSALDAMGGAMSSGLEITVRGDNYDDVTLASNQLLAEIEAAREDEASDSGNGSLADRMNEARRKALSKIEDLTLDLASIEPTLLIELDTAELVAMGYSQEQITDLKREFYLVRYGETVAQANLDGIMRDIYIEGAVKDPIDIEMISELPVGWPIPVPLGDIATVELGEQATRISRFDGKVSATITGKITEENVGAVSQAIQEEIDSLEVPDGVEISQGGITEDMRDSFKAMFIAIPIAMGLAYVVLVLTFRSFRNPIIIMVSMPLASIGALVGLLVTGRPLGVSGLMGILMLVGIVLTNAVVLIAVVEQMRKEGMSPYQALVEGARTRLRPILMTALTTMIAMLPLAFGLGEGVMMAAELATVVIGGLLSSTLLTLLVIPVVYAVANRVPRIVTIKK
ncbi:MAG TPA: efflux RND transporter permease subunit [Dehalococcoidia bacterium]|nr:efflux RND transporter permease subunit [Dehalococcoidia bacterium]